MCVGKGARMGMETEMGVKFFGWVHCGGPEIGVLRGLGGCGGTDMGLKGIKVGVNGL